MINAFLNTTRCTVSTLSPVHIGCGEDYYPTNYVIDGGFLHHFSEEELLASLNPTERKNLINLTSQIDEDGIKELQRLIYSKKDQLKNNAIHHVIVSKELEKFYQKSIKGEGKNKLEIARHAFNPYSQSPYLAGSSIKGAIRTTLLNALNENKPLPPEFRGTEKQDVLEGSNGVLQKRLLKYEEIGDDPLRLLKIGDAHYQHPDDLHSLEIRFAVNRKKEKKGPYQILECLPANRSRSLNFDVNFLTSEKRAYCHDIEILATACNDFFLPQLEKELELIEEFNYANALWIKGIRNLLKNELHEAFEKQQAFLLRVGQHSGAVSHTLDGVRHIHIPQIKKYLKESTSIWLAGDDNDQLHNLLPFGWILVEVDNTYLEQTATFLTEQCCLQYLDYKQKIATKKRAEQERLENEKALAKEQEQANMTDSEKAQHLIFELRQEYEKATPKTQPIGGTLNPQLTAIINQAANWSNEDRQALFALGNEINKTLWNDNKKVKDRLKTLQG